MHTEISGRKIRVQLVPCKLAANISVSLPLLELSREQCHIGAAMFALKSWVMNEHWFTATDCHLLTTASLQLVTVIWQGVVSQKRRRGVILQKRSVKT
jgi:hypothetical protein